MTPFTNVCVYFISVLNKNNILEHRQLVFFPLERIANYVKSLPV